MREREDFRKIHEVYAAFGKGDVPDATRCVIRPDNAPRAHFSATVGEEPEVEVRLV